MIIWQANVRLLQRFPWFGTGIGTHLNSHALEVDRPDNNLQFTHAESGYLQVASECGFAGLIIAGLMIVVCLHWCRRAYRLEAGSESTAMAGAIAAGIAANLLHSFVDFFWYAPGCMVTVCVLAACACRLSQMASLPEGVPEPVRSSSRLRWAASVCGAAAFAAWMISIKLPGALAEPHFMAFLMLQHHGADVEEDHDEVEALKLTELLAAARADPRDCRVQLLTAQAFLAAFGRRQIVSEVPMMLDQIRDAAVASEFDSVAALNEWLDAVTGPNRKYLKAAQYFARRCVRDCPLEGRGYILLARLDFLRDPRTVWKNRCSNRRWQSGRMTQWSISRSAGRCS